MHRENGFISVGNTLQQGFDFITELFRNGITHGVRNIDGTRTSVDGGFNNAAQEIVFRTAGVFAGKLHIFDKTAGFFHRIHGLLHHLIRLHAQLVLHVDG